MTTVLALDSSTSLCSVALWHRDRCWLEAVDSPREHSQRLLPLVEALLAQAQLRPADIDALAFGRGPGSFTGLRIATSMVQGLAFALDRPVIPVSTLRALAWQGVAHFGLRNGDLVVPVLDARMAEVYWSVYAWRDGALVAQTEEHVSAPEALSWQAAPGSRLVGVGDGWQVPALAGRLGVADLAPGLLPRADAIAQLAVADLADGLAVPAEQAQPVYLRNEVAWQKRQRLRTE